MSETIPSLLKAKVVEWDRAKGYGFLLVNNRTLARGETAVVNLADRSVSVLCVDIRESSVLINIDDAPTTYELKLN